MDYQFRNALNGFHKEDVVAYLEATNQAHQQKLQRLQNLITTSEERYAELEEREQEYMGKISDLEAEISTITINSGVKIADYEDHLMEGDHEAMEALRQEMEEYKRAAKERSVEMESMRQDYEEQLVRMDDDYLLLKEKYEALDGGGSAGSSEDDSEYIQNLENQIDDLKRELATANSGSSHSSDVENDLRDEIYVLEDEVTALRKQLEEAGSGGGGAAPANGGPSEEILDLQDEIQVLEDETKSLRKQIDNLSDQLAEAEEQLESKETSAVPVASVDTSGLEEELEQTKSELKVTLTRLENMAVTMDELETSLDVAELELKQLKSNQDEPPVAPAVVPAMPAPGVEQVSGELDSAKMEIASMSLKLQEATQRAEDMDMKLNSMTQTIADLEFTAQGYDARTQQLLSRLENAECENKRLLAIQADDRAQKDLQLMEAELRQLKDRLLVMKEEEDSLRSQLATAETTIATLESEAISPAVVEEKEKLAEELRVAEEKLAGLSQLKSQVQKQEADLVMMDDLLAEVKELKQLQERLSVMKTLEDDLAKVQEALTESQDSLEKEKESNISLKSFLEEAQNELSGLPQLRKQLEAAQEELEGFGKLKVQLEEAQEELLSFGKTKSQLREAREEVEALSRVKLQLREAQDEIDSMSKVKSQLREVELDLEHANKYKTKHQETLEEMQQLEKKIADLEGKLELATNSAEEAVKAELKALSDALNDLELTLGDEKRHNATLSTELDGLREELTKRKNSEWNLQEDLKKLQTSHDTLAHKITRLEPPAKAYLNIKDRMESMEQEARFRAQETINSAENEAYRMQQQVEQWLARINSSYSSLCKELDENISNVDQGLARASNALSQISSVIKTQDTAFSHLGRMISATSSAGNNNEPANMEQTSSWQGNPTENWDSPPTPDWSTSTIPNSASPGNWSAAPSPLPIEDRSKPFDLYEELEALDDFDE